jgi:hypothetical protein
VNAKVALRKISPAAIPVPVKAPARVIVKLLEDSNVYGLDPVLVPTDRLLKRWAVSQGGDEYMTGWDEAPARSRPTPLPDDMAIIVDQTILHSTVQARNFVHRWYMRPGESVTVLAKALGLHRDTVHMRWRSTLWYMRRRFLDVQLDV